MFFSNTFTNFPILYGEKEKKLCANSFLLDIIDHEKVFLNEDFRTLKKNKLLQDIKKKEFYEAYTLFQSRTYQYVNAQNQTVSAFIPLVDLFNYKEERELGHHKVAWKFDTTSNTFIVYAFEDIPKGSKVNHFIYKLSYILNTEVTLT